MKAELFPWQPHLKSLHHSRRPPKYSSVQSLPMSSIPAPVRSTLVSHRETCNNFCTSPISSHAPQHSTLHTTNPGVFKNDFLLYLEQSPASWPLSGGPNRPGSWLHFHCLRLGQCQPSHPASNMLVPSHCRAFVLASPAPRSALPPGIQESQSLTSFLSYFCSVSPLQRCLPQQVRLKQTLHPRSISF